MDESNYSVSMDIVINVLIGIVLGYILYKGYLCPTTFHGPNSRDIMDKVYNVNGKLYTLEPVVCASVHIK